MKFDLGSRAGIRSVAKSLVDFIERDRVDLPSGEWTDGNFTRLREFFVGDPSVTYYHKPRKDKSDDPKEFMWDFLAIRANAGILLAAESEQTHKHLPGLEHDFEKLLYVSSPLRLFVTKAETEDKAKDLVGALAEYATRCCMHFNPGSIFIIHLHLPDCQSTTYWWQSGGDLPPIEAETIGFERVL